MKIDPQVSYAAEEVENGKPKVKNGTKQWVRDLASDYDLCVVFPSQDNAGIELDEKGSQCIAKLREHAFEIFAYVGNDKEKSIFVLLRAPIEKLRAFADINNFSLLLDPVVARAKLESGNPNKNIAPVLLEHQPDITKLEPFSNLYGKYSRLVDESLFFRESDKYDHPFSRSIRLKLSVLILQSRPPSGSEALKLKRCMKKGIIKACFPLHAPYTMDTFRAQWMQYPFKPIPLEDVKNYFGEEIALYYAFMNHYNNYLLPVAIVGLAFQIAIWYLNNYSAPFVPFYSIILAVWAVIMLEYWKRHEKLAAFKWGTANYENSENDRSEFRGDKIKSVVDGSQIRYFSSSRRQSLLRQSYSIILIMLVLVAAATAAIYYGRFYLRNTIGTGNAALSASVANALTIQFFNWLYKLIAVSLNDRENHRTDSGYAENMVVKVFLFQFVNSYASFYYVAFAARYAGDCEPKACLTSLAINLATLYISQVIVGNTLELLIPYLMYKYKYYTYIKKNVDRISRPEVEFLLEPYDLMESSLGDYSEVVIRFGFKALFATALPLTSFFALVSNYVEVRCDGWKMMNVHQRPFLHGVQDIGAWQGILTVVVTISVITNAGLIVFALDIFPAGYSVAFQYWVFILFQWVLFFLQGVIMAAIPDVPEEIEIQNRRCEFIVEKLIEQVADDNDVDVTPPEGNSLQLQPNPLGGGFFKKADG